jgi:hypothetical protein
MDNPLQPKIETVDEKTALADSSTVLPTKLSKLQRKLLVCALAAYESKLGKGYPWLGISYARLISVLFGREQLPLWSDSRLYAKDEEAYRRGREYARNALWRAGRRLIGRGLGVHVSSGF